MSSSESSAQTPEVQEEQTSPSGMGFSWKYKLIALTVITLVGLLVLSISSSMGLDSVSAGYDKMHVAESYRRQSLLLANGLFELDRASNSLDSSKIGSLKESVASLSIHAQELQASAGELDQGGLGQMAGALSAKMDDYQLSKTLWLDLNSEVGFSPEEGLWAVVDAEAKKLDGLVKLELIAKPIEQVINNQKNLLATHDMAFANEVNKALGTLEQVVIERKWEKIVIGKTVSSYRTAFDSLNEKMVSIVSAKAKNTQLEKEMEENVRQQSLLLDEDIVVQAAEAAGQAKSVARTTIIVVSSLVGVVLLFSLVSVATRLNKQLGRMGRLLDKVAKGDLTDRLDITRNKKDEFNQLGLTVNKMVSDMSDVIGNVVRSSHSLLDVKGRLSSASEHMASTSTVVEQQTEASTQATKQISEAVSEVVQSTSDVDSAVKKVTESTKAGVEITTQSVDSMSSIAELMSATNDEVKSFSGSSEKMEGIIDVINSLADQTNLLALNASIESARAGEAGRGFAVVADEVRALAQKTVDATGSIGEIIHEFNGRADRMSKLMEQGTGLVESGQSKVANVSQLFGEINESFEQVASGVTDVADSVEDISKATDGISSQMGLIYDHTLRAKEVRQEVLEHIADLTEQSETLERTSTRFSLGD